MYGAFIGDIVGSKYEFNNIRTKSFPLFSPDCDYTDDSIMSAAVAKAIIDCSEMRAQGSTVSFREILIRTMRDFGSRYPNPTGSYGGGFSNWLRSENPTPYGSYGNGSAMRVSACGLCAVTLDEAKALARASADITHNHPDGIMGAEAVAAAVFLAKAGKCKEEIKSYFTEHYYKIDFTLDTIRETYYFDPSCKGTVPQALEAFFESESFEDAIRNAISIGGDSDTIGAITGSVAWVYYAMNNPECNWYSNIYAKPMESIKNQAAKYLPDELKEIDVLFHSLCLKRADEYQRTGHCTDILSKEEM